MVMTTPTTAPHLKTDCISSPSYLLEEFSLTDPAAIVLPQKGEGGHLVNQSKCARFACCLSAVGNIQFHKDIFDMGFDGGWGHL